MAASRPGSAEWVGETLAAHWGLRPDLLRPLAGADGALPLTHTAGLWECRAGGRALVLKAQLNPDAVRAADFYPLKAAVVEHCRRRGVPAAQALPTRDGEVAVRRDGVLCELVPRYRGSPLRLAAPATVREAVRTALTLRRALDDLPEEVAARLAGMPVDPLVDEPDPLRALAEAAELLPLAEARNDTWGELAAGGLREVLASAPLLDPAHREAVAGVRPPGPAASGGSRSDGRDVVHADLHREHFLTGPHGVEAILDFDNTRSGDRLLDLAWTAELCVSAAAPDDPSGPETLRWFVGTAHREGVLAEGEERLLMPALVEAAVPVVVDIAKDILQRDILSPAWAQYIDLLSPARRVRLHALLGASP